VKLYTYIVKHDKGLMGDKYVSPRECENHPRIDLR
jgi:hypothetical protein